MENEVLVKVEGVGKKFCRDLKRSLAYGVQDLTKEILGVNREQLILRKDEFWAVKDISFELRRGECLGLIGHNGAGKSTLLKMLNGLIKPDVGKITMKGKISALIELGAGFNPILTGRENIFVNGQILGFSRKEVETKFDEIVAFSEIGEFIDTPVQNYSSGMKVRLGFAVAAQMEPDVLIIDEVLAVGDTGFRAKCLNRIGELQNSSAVIFVSHSMPMISRISTEVLLMDRGICKYQGSSVTEGIDKLLNSFQGLKFSIVGYEKGISIKSFTINSKSAISETIRLHQYDNVDMAFEFTTDEKIDKFKIAYAIIDQEMKPVAVIADVLKDRYYHANASLIQVNCSFKNELAPGRFYLSVHVNAYKDGKRIFLVEMMQITTFLVVGNNLFTSTPVQFESKFSGTLIE